MIFIVDYFYQNEFKKIKKKKFVDNPFKLSFGINTIHMSDVIVCIKYWLYLKFVS